MIYSRALRLPAFAAASTNNTVPSDLTTAEAELHHGQLVERRAAQAGRNSPIVSMAHRTRRRGLCSNPVPQCASEELRQAWQNWAMGNVGYKASHGTFAAQLVRISAEVSEVGAVWVHKMITGGSPNGLRLQLWPDALRVREYTIGDWQSGIRYDDDGDIAAVMFRARSSSAAEPYKTQTEIAGNDLFFVRHALAAGQIGGTSPVVQALEADEMLRQYGVNGLETARTRAGLTFIVEHGDSNVVGRNRLVKGSAGASFTDANGRVITTFRPGAVAHAWNGAQVKVPDLRHAHDLAAQFERRISAGTGFARELIGGEVGDANFSALRMARNAAAEDGCEMQDLVGWFSMLRWLTEAWIFAEWLEDRHWTLDQFTWLPRIQAPLDRYKDAAADELLLNMGIVSRQELIRQRNRDPRDIEREQRQDQEMGLGGPIPDQTPAQGGRDAPRLQILP